MQTAKLRDHCSFTSGLRKFYVRSPEVLRPVSGSSTSGLRKFYARSPEVLRPVSRSSTSGLRKLFLLPVSGISASGLQKFCVRSPEFLRPVFGSSLFYVCPPKGEERTLLAFLFLPQSTGLYKAREQSRVETSTLTTDNSLIHLNQQYQLSQ